MGHTVPVGGTQEVLCVPILRIVWIVNNLLPDNVGLPFVLVLADHLVISLAGLVGLVTLNLVYY